MRGGLERLARQHETPEPHANAAGADKALTRSLDAATTVLDQRLAAQSDRPIAVALSGGGDSVALLLVTADWARRNGRRLLVLTVDHRLRPDSVAWTMACAARAASLGQAFQALAWTGDKPSRGLPAAARAARHALLADAARQAGARVILMGHTADDRLEAQAMREEGASTPSPREWSPSPAWPQGRGLFLLRPLLALRRAQIRDWLAERKERWIEDPANDDLAFARARARRRLAGAGRFDSPAVEAPLSLALACDSDPSGALRIARDVLRCAPPKALARFVSAACLCAAGTDRPPQPQRVERVVARLLGPEDFVASLAGARVEADDADVRFLREAGEAARGGLAPLRLSAGRATIWDGRFHIEPGEAVMVRALAGIARSLPRADQAIVTAFPPSARRGLPVLVGPNGGVSLPVLQPLALERLQAACGLVEAEPA